MCFFVSDEGSRSNHRIRPCEQAPRCEFSRLSSDNQRLCDGAFSPKGRADTYALSSHKISKLNITRCSAVGSERGKTVNDCFDEVISPKQGAGEASVSSDNQRLCDGAFSPKGRADTYALSSHKISKLNITRCSAVGSAPVSGLNHHARRRIFEKSRNPLKTLTFSALPNVEKSSISRSDHMFDHLQKI